MIRRRLFPILLLVLTACGSHEVIIATDGALSPVPTSSPQRMLSAFPAPSTVEQAIDQLRSDTPSTRSKPPRKPRRSTQVDYGRMGPAQHNTMALTVTLSATCVMPGQAMQATAETLAGAKLAFAAGYSSNDFAPNFTYVPGEGNPTGTFTWTWEIAPTTPRGNAVVMVVAGKDDKGASYKAPFRVSDSC